MRRQPGGSLHIFVEAGHAVLIKREWIDKWLETANQEVARLC